MRALLRLVLANAKEGSGHSIKNGINPRNLGTIVYGIEGTGGTIWIRRAAKEVYQKGA